MQNAWSQIDVQLKRENAFFQTITQTRAEAMAVDGNIQDSAAAESRLSTALGRLFAVAENYPQLRAVENFQALEEELLSTENRIAYARQFYNDEVMK